MDLKKLYLILGRTGFVLFLVSVLWWGALYAGLPRPDSIGMGSAGGYFREMQTKLATTCFYSFGSSCEGVWFSSKSNLPRYTPILLWLGILLMLVATVVRFSLAKTPAAAMRAAPADSNASSESGSEPGLDSNPQRGAGPRFSNVNINPELVDSAKATARVAAIETKAAALDALSAVKFLASDPVGRVGGILAETAEERLYKIAAVLGLVSVALLAFSWGALSTLPLARTFSSLFVQWVGWLFAFLGVAVVLFLGLGRAARAASSALVITSVAFAPLAVLVLVASLLRYLLTPTLALATTGAALVFALGYAALIIQSALQSVSQMETRRVSWLSASALVGGWLCYIIALAMLS